MKVAAIIIIFGVFLFCMFEFFNAIQRDIAQDEWEMQQIERRAEIRARLMKGGN